VDGTGFLWARVPHATAEHASKPSSAKELGKQVLGIHTAHAASLLVQPLLSVLIVHAALLGVRQDFIGGGDLLELFSRLGISRVFVWCKLDPSTSEPR
jgi:hypothetical protein